MASGNVTSVVRNGTGRYTVNFTSAMPDANFSAIGTPGGSTGVSQLRGYEDATPRTASSWTFITLNVSDNFADAEWINVAIFR